MNLTIQQKQQLLKLVEQIPIKSCDRCELYSFEGICREFNSKVPEHYIIKGCDKWIEGVPF